MSDFYQTGEIATFHRFGNIDLERMESELKIAHDIQMSILPKTFPPFPTREEFDLYALIAPAREVGGDFYDFFQLSENLLCFVIGDVSGKGVPAALFMAVMMPNMVH